MVILPAAAVPADLAEFFEPFDADAKTDTWTVATSPLSSKKLGCDTEHYAAFPPELVRPMVRAGCPPDGVVLDCFMGSGTTGLVAVQEGRRFVGIDLNAAYVDLARRRIATAQPPLALAI